MIGDTFRSWTGWITAVRRGTAARLAAVAMLGVMSGWIGAYSYYDDLLRPLAHTLGIWILLAAVVSARLPARPAMLRSTVALFFAVLTFYVGKARIYSHGYAGIGISLDRIALWCVFALIAGSVLGVLLHSIGGRGWRAAAATAAAIGLLIADTARRGYAYTDQVPVLVTFLVVAISVVVFVLADRSPRQIGRTALLSGPCAALGYLIVSMPDIIEQVVFIGIQQ